VGARGRKRMGCERNRDNWVDIATGYGLDDWDSIPRKDIHNVHTGNGAHADSCSVGTGAISPGVKRKVCEANHSTPCSAEVKNFEAIPPLPHVFMV
jgi:hypothetical protein